MKSSVLFLILLGMVMTSCYYDSEEYLYPQSAICDTSNVLFSTSIKPVIDNYCLTCHSGGSPDAGVSLESYLKIQELAVSGQLLHVLNGTGGAPQMPPGGSLSACNIAKFGSWIKLGAKNN